MNKTPIITLANSFDIDSPAIRFIVDDFMGKVFNQDPDEVLITDESEVWDFMMCAMPETVDTSGLSLDEMYGLAEQFTEQKFRELYHIEVAPFDSLVDVAKKIKDSKVS